jgi:antitoxin MazE
MSAIARERGMYGMAFSLARFFFDDVAPPATSTIPARSPYYVIERLPECRIAVILQSCYSRIVARKTGKVLVEVTDRGTITLPKPFRNASLYEIREREGGGLELIPQHTIDAAQAWFWSERWQRMEREATADISAGRVTEFDSADDFIAELDKH